MRNKMMRLFAYTVLTFGYYGTIILNGLILLYAAGIMWIVGKIQENRERLVSNVNQYVLDEVTIYAAITMAFLGGMLLAEWLFAAYWGLMSTVTVTPVIVQ